MVPAAVTCTIIVIGYKAGVPIIIASQTFSFVPAEAIDVMNPSALGTIFRSFNVWRVSESPTSLLRTRRLI